MGDLKLKVKICLDFRSEFFKLLDGSIFGKDLMFAVGLRPVSCDVDGTLAAPLFDLKMIRARKLFLINCRARVLQTPPPAVLAALIRMRGVGEVSIKPSMRT